MPTQTGGISRKEGERGHYWMNKDTNLVSDEPLEAWLYPSNWGELAFE